MYSLSISLNCLYYITSVSYTHLTIAICGKGHETKPVLRPFCDKALLDKHNGQVLKYLPKSDEVSFAGSRIPTMSLCVVPRWDIQYLKAMATYGDGFLGRPPEFDMMLEQMEVITTMHGGYRDNPQYVEEDAMMQVYGYLLELSLIHISLK